MRSGLNATIPNKRSQNTEKAIVSFSELNRRQSPLSKIPGSLFSPVWNASGNPLDRHLPEYLRGYGLSLCSVRGVMRTRTQDSFFDSVHGGAHIPLLHGSGRGYGALFETTGSEVWSALFSGSGRFSMAWNPNRLQLGQRPNVYFFRDQAHNRMPYLPHGSVNPHRVHRTCHPGALFSGSILSSFSLALPTMGIWFPYNTLGPFFCKLSMVFAAHSKESQPVR